MVHGSGPRLRSARLRVALAATVVGLFGCTLARDEPVEEPIEEPAPKPTARREPAGAETLVFPHRAHVAEQGFDCADCHLSCWDGDDPGMPGFDRCVMCHGDMDAQKPPDRRVSVLFAGEELQASHRGRLDGDVVFSHLQHVTEVDDCTVCHAEIGWNESLAELGLVTMQDCAKCHADNGIATDCAACHRGAIEPEG